jgi:hypothetical protein
VDGPLVATRLCPFARRVSGRPLSRLTFRAKHHASWGNRFRLVARRAHARVQLRAERNRSDWGDVGLCDRGLSTRSQGRCSLPMIRVCLTRASNAAARRPR